MAAHRMSRNDRAFSLRGLHSSWVRFKALFPLGATRSDRLGCNFVSSSWLGLEAPGGLERQERCGRTRGIDLVPMILSRSIRI